VPEAYVGLTADECSNNKTCPADKLPVNVNELLGVEFAGSSAAGKYSYRLKQIDNDGTFEYSKIIEIDVYAPFEFKLSQNYPNPFNPSTTITFTLPVNEIVSLSVYNMLGEEIHILQNGFLEAGMYSYNYDAEGIPSGVYFYKLETPTKILHRKMLLIK